MFPFIIVSVFLELFNDRFRLHDDCMLAIEIVDIFVFIKFSFPSSTQFGFGKIMLRKLCIIFRLLVCFPFDKVKWKKNYLICCMSFEFSFDFPIKHWNAKPKTKQKLYPPFSQPIHFAYDLYAILVSLPVLREKVAECMRNKKGVYVLGICLCWWWYRRQALAVCLSWFI